MKNLAVFNLYWIRNLGFEAMVVMNRLTGEGIMYQTAQIMFPGCDFTPVYAKS